MRNIKKQFYVIAYDIVNDRKRNHVSSILEKYGTRVNFSVFECFVTIKQLEDIKGFILKEIDCKTDTVAYYPICLECYSKIEYQGANKDKGNNIVVTL